MVSIPQPRSRPTVKPLATMNRRVQREWELRLSKVSTMVVLGVVLGSLLSAYFLGYMAGQSVGYDSAVQTALSSSARFPIHDVLDDPELSAERSSEIFAKLSQKDRQALDSTEEDLPSLGVIENVEVTERDLDLNELRGKETDGVANSGTGSALGRGFDRSKTGAGKVSIGFKSSRPELKSELKEKVKNRTLAESMGEASQSEKDKLEKSANQVVRLGDSPKSTTDSSAKTKSVPAVEVIPFAGRASKQAESAPAVEGEPFKSKYVRSKIPLGWYAQVSAPKSGREADALAGKIRGSGFPVMIEKVSVRGEQYYRVLVGPEDSRELGERLISQLNRERGLGIAAPFLKLVR